jgi:predicted nucleotide-binding protein
LGGGGIPIQRTQGYLADSKAKSLMLLDLAIAGLEERLSEIDDAPVAAPSIPEATSASRKVFVVHGHDGEPKHAMARFLESLELEVVILDEQANRGRTIIEKFEDHADVGFAVVLLTPDDLGKAKAATDLKPRARQNVVLELGYFMGRLSRRNVCALKLGDLEEPSDFRGVAYVPYDAGGAWRQSLGQELQEAGYEIDWNKVMRQ